MSEITDKLLALAHTWRDAAKHMDAEVHHSSDDVAGVYRECASDIEELVEDILVQCTTQYVTDFVKGVQDARCKQDAQDAARRKRDTEDSGSSGGE